MRLRLKAQSPNIALKSIKISTSNRHLSRVLARAMTKRERDAESYTYLVLGGGNSAGYVASSFHENGVGKDLAILSDEPVVSYERPTLSKAYLFPEEPARLPKFHTTAGGGGEPRSKDWYKEQGITFKTGTKVVGVDIKNRSVSTESGDQISFEKLIIALGSVAVNLADSGTKGADLENIYYLRNTVDADALVKGIASAKAAGNKVVVVGGGYIGLEVAAACALNDLDTTIVMPSDRFMPRLFTKEIADLYESYYKSKGVKIIKKEHVTGFQGNGKVAKAELKSGGTLDCDIVVVGIGARPNVDLFKGQLELLEDKPGGIKVNGHLETSTPGVYAIGDVAAFPLKAAGGSVTRQEHVAHARQSAAHVVSHVLKPDSTDEYDYRPFFYSREFDLSWQFYGDNSGADDTIFFGSKDLKKPRFGTFFIKDNKINGIFIESGTDDENAAAKKIANQRPQAPSDLAEQGFKFLNSFS